MFERLLEALAALPSGTTYLVLMLLSALENVFPPVPADVAVALGAFLAQRGELQPWRLGALCWLANLLSSAGIYAAARRHGPAFRSGIGKHLLPNEAMKAIEEAYRQYGPLGIFFSRFLPGLRAAVLPFAGIAGVPAFRALVPAGLASALWYTFLIEAGSAVGDNWEAVRELVENVNRSLGFVAVLVAAALFVWLRRRSRRG